MFPLYDGSVKPGRFVIMHEDVTARRLAEEKLNEATLLNKGIVDNAKEGIEVYGLDLHILLFNPFMEKLTGMQAKQVLGKHPLEVFSFLKEVGVIGRLEKVLRGETPPPLEFPFLVRKTGKQGWASDVSY